ncbi:MAG TPA: hypothetical protein PLP23_13760 [Panacibacter sp.]|nr:hypothetical protein [Panacibacter sp.]
MYNPTVQVSDTTGDAICTIVGYKNIFTFSVLFSAQCPFIAMSRAKALCGLKKEIINYYLFSAQCPFIAMSGAKALCGLRTKSLIVIRRFSNSIDFTNFPKSKPCL